MKKQMISGALAIGILLTSSGIVAWASELPAESAASSAATSTSQAATASASDAPAAASSQAAQAPATNMAGFYSSFDEARYPDDRAPNIELSEGGGFVFQINLGDGRLAVMTGTYVNSGSALSMEVLYTDSTDFLGDDITTLVFSPDGATSLVYQGEPLGMTRAGDVFASSVGGGTSGFIGQNVYILAPGEVVDL